MTEQEKIERRKLLIDRINRKMFTDEDKGCVKSSEIASFVESEIDRIIEPLVKAINRSHYSFLKNVAEIQMTKHMALSIRDNNMAIGYNKCIDDLDQLSPDVEALAKEMFEVCCYPDPTKWEEITQNEKDVWIYRASIIIDKINKWIKK